MEPPDIIAKILIEGVYTSGKTSLLIRFADNKFLENSYNVIGMDFKIKKMVINKVSYKLQIWDKPQTNYRFESYNRNLYRNVSGIVYAFDCISQPYADLEKTIPEIRKNLPNGGSGIPIVIACTKIDLVPGNENIPPERLITFAKNNVLKIVCCSSKTGIGVEEVFCSVITEMNSNADYWKSKEETEIIVSLNINDKKTSSFCL